MTDNEYNRRSYQRIQEELAEADELRNRTQAQLDRWWQAQRERDAPDDIYEVGGFLERWSHTPSYTKSRRDRDWRVR